MICLAKNKDGADILVEYFGRTLEAQRTAELESHAAECAECRGLLGAWNALDEWEAPEVSADFDAKLYARIAGESRVPWWKRALVLPGFSWKSAIPVAAGCGVLALALMIHDPDGGPPALAPDAKAKLEMVNMDQVEQVLDDLDLFAPPKGPEEL
jgi:hypothetical protein